MTRKNDDWFVTHSGRRVWLSEPRHADISIEDIAHGLSHVCRFGGHVRQFYSVAQHSVHVSLGVPEEFALQALLHDATEAYLGDVIRPLKRLLGDYKKIENSWWEVIADRFQVPRKLWPSVKQADVMALATERRDLVNAPTDPRGEWEWMEDELGIDPDPNPLIALPPGAAREMFLERFAELTGEV